MRCSLLTLSCYLDGELDSRRQGEMEAHLVACSRCRAGLQHLREEVERVEGLAPVHVRDASVQTMFEQVGLVEVGGPIPPRLTRPAGHVADGLPWLMPAPGAALPWTAPPRAPRALASRHEEAGVHLHGSAHRLRGDTLGGVPAVPFPLDRVRTPTASTNAPVPPPQRHPPSAREGGTRRTNDRSSNDDEDGHGAVVPTPPEDNDHLMPRPPDGDAARSADPLHVPLRPAHGGPPVAVSSPRPPRGPDQSGTVPGQTGPLLAPRPTLFERVRDRIAVRRALRVGPDGLDDEVEVVSGIGAPDRPIGRSDLARRRSDALRPAADASLDPRREPTLRSQLPPPARPSAPLYPRDPGLVPRRPSRVSETPVGGATSMAHMGGTTTSHPVLDRPSASARWPRTDVRTAPLWPLVDGGDSTADADAIPLEARGVPHTDRRPAPATLPLPWDPVVDPLSDAELEQAQFVGPSPMVATPAQRVWSPAEAQAPLRRAPQSETAQGRRRLVVVGGVLASVLLAGVLSARVERPLPAPAAAIPPVSATGGDIQLPPPPPAHQQAPAAAGTGTASTGAPAAAAASPAQTLGSGGTGWHLDGVRFGDHTSYYRMVFDLSGGSAAPTISFTQIDPQTIQVTFAGTSAAGAPITPPSGALVTRVGLVTPSVAPNSATYRISLTRPATAKGLLYGSVKLVLDLS